MKNLKLQIIIILHIIIPLLHANYITLQVTANVTTINTAAKYSFLLQRNFGVYNNFLTNIPSVPLNSIIKIIFPNKYTSISDGTYTCASSTNSLNCNILSNVLTIQGYYALSSSLSDLYVQINVNNIINTIKSGSTG